jgi:hypothetical protein
MCCQCTHQGGDWGPERTRTGGWSLLGVMSDWQHGVDRLLAKYCRCMLRLDLCWCRWRVGVKGLSLCGLWGVERQVGSARWTSGWTRSSKDRMVARKARRSWVRFFGWASNSWWSQCKVAAKSLYEARLSRPSGSRRWKAWRARCLVWWGHGLHAGFSVVHQKTVGFLGCSTKLSTAVCWFGHKTNTEPRRRGGQVMSGIGVEAAPSSRGLRQFTTKPSVLLGWATKLRLEARRAETRSGRVEKLRSGRYATWSRCLHWEDAKAWWMRGRLMENFMCWPTLWLVVCVLFHFRGLWERGRERSEWFFVWAFCHPRFVILRVSCNPTWHEYSEWIHLTNLVPIPRANPISFQIPELVLVPFSELFGLILVRRLLGRFLSDFFEEIMGGCIVHLCVWCWLLKRLDCLRFASFGWNPSFLVELGRISIPLISVDLRLQIRRYSIS